MNIESRRRETRLSFLELLQLEQCYRDGKSAKMAAEEIGCSYRRVIERYAQFREGAEVLTEKQYREIHRIAERRGYKSNLPDRHYKATGL